MDPVAPVLVLFYKEFIVILLNLIRVFYQYSRILYRLLYTATTDIHSATSQVITRTHTPYPFIQLRATISRVNNDGILPSFGGKATGRRALLGNGARGGGIITVIIPLSQHFQLNAKAFQVLNGYMAWDVIHFRIITLRKLPEQKVLGELHLTVCRYFCHCWFMVFVNVIV